MHAPRAAAARAADVELVPDGPLLRKHGGRQIRQHHRMANPVAVGGRGRLAGQSAADAEEHDRHRHEGHSQQPGGGSSSQHQMAVNQMSNAQNARNQKKHVRDYSLRTASSSSATP